MAAKPPKKTSGQSPRDAQNANAETLGIVRLCETSMLGERQKPSRFLHANTLKPAASLLRSDIESVNILLNRG
jgi:hypothetical protein